MREATSDQPGAAEVRYNGFSSRGYDIPDDHPLVTSLAARLHATGRHTPGARLHHRHDRRGGLRQRRGDPRRLLRALCRGRARRGRTGVPSVRGADRPGAGPVRQRLVRPGLIAAVLVALVVLIVVARWYVRRERSRVRSGRRHGRRCRRGSHRPIVADTVEQAVDGRPARRHPGDPALLPDERDAGVLRLRHGVQPARHRPMGPQLQVRQLLRLIRRMASQRVRARRSRRPRTFESIEEICNYLLGHKEVVDYVRGRGPGGKVAFLMFDEETETLAAELGLEVAFPPAALRHRLDSKIETTRLGNEAGVPSVPNIDGARRRPTARCSTWHGGAGLGDDLVIQTPYGDSGQTTFFVASEYDWKADEEKIVGEDLKVMKRIDPRETAIEGVITRHGTLVGPLMAELTGFPELTPYDGGWCGNDVFPDVLTREQRAARARAHVRRSASAYAQEGYRGYFELDFLADANIGRDVPGRAEPQGHRGQQHHERHRGRLRRHAAVPVPPAGVHGRRLRDRRRRAEPALGAPRQPRRVDAVHPEADRGRRWS